MSENEEFKMLCDKAMERLNIGKTDLAKRLGVDPKTQRRYCTDGDIPKSKWAAVLSLATGKPRKGFEENIREIFREIYENAIKK